MGAADVMDLHSKGLAVSVIVKRLGCSRQYVYQVLEKHGLKPNPTTKARRIRAAVAAVANGKSASAAAKQYDLAYRTVYNAAVREGVLEPARQGAGAKRQFMQINVRLDQHSNLKEVAGELGISMSELVRRSVDSYVQEFYGLGDEATAA